MEENEETVVNPETEELPLEEEDDVFEESFDDVDEDAADTEEEEEEYEDTEELENELFRENPLKALWIRLGEVKELLEND